MRLSSGFSKRAEGIDRGIRDHGLTYPIALDNDFATWRALDNDAWPAKYLFDAQGKLVKRWVGEGRYGEIEAEIRRLLAAAMPGAQLPAVTSEVAAFAKAGEPSYAGITNETYVGVERREPGTFTLEGDWQSSRQYVELRKGSGKIIMRFTAAEVNLVMQPGLRLAVTGCSRRKTSRRGISADVVEQVAHVDRSGMIRLVAGAPGKHVHGARRQRSRRAGVCVHLRPLTPRAVTFGGPLE